LKGFFSFSLPPFPFRGFVFSLTSIYENLVPELAGIYETFYSIDIIDNFLFSHYWGGPKNAVII